MFFATVARFGVFCVGHEPVFSASVPRCFLRRPRVFIALVSSLSGRTSSVVAAGCCTNASGEVAAAQPVVLSMGSCIVAEGKNQELLRAHKKLTRVM